MANVVVLDNISHRHLTVVQGYLLSPYDGLGAITVFPSELDSAHKEFPIFIRKHGETGQFFLTALLALDNTSNFYFNQERWQTRYIPFMARRGPFLMTRAQNDDAIRMCIDLDDQRVQASGERLFDEQGQPTALTKRAATLLNFIHEGHEQTQQLMSALAQLNLIEALSINVNTSADRAGMLNGIYSINAEKLKALTSDALNKLNANGFLQMAYFIASSSSNIIPLIEHSESSR